MIDVERVQKSRFNLIRPLETNQKGVRLFTTRSKLLALSTRQKTFLWLCSRRRKSARAVDRLGVRHRRHVERLAVDAEGEPVADDPAVQRNDGVEDVGTLAAAALARLSRAHVGERDDRDGSSTPRLLLTNSFPRRLQHLPYHVVDGGDLAAEGLCTSDRARWRTQMRRRWCDGELAVIWVMKSSRAASREWPRL